MRRVALSKKFAGDVRNPFEVEATLNEMQPTTEQQHKELLDVVTQLESGTSLSAEEKKALIVWKTNLLAETIEPHIKKRFAADFWAWLMGRGRPEDVKNTPWGRQSLTDDPEVRAYVDMFIDKRTFYQTALQKLSMRRPVGINQCYLYYKYLVRQKLKEGNVFELDFLKDWHEFGTDFEKARTAGQQSWNPKGHVNEMAPYQDIGNDIAGKLAAEREAKNELPPDFRSKMPSGDIGPDDDPGTAGQPKNREPPQPPRGGGDGEAVTAAVKKMSEAMETFSSRLLEQKGAIYAEGLHNKYKQEVEARTAQLQAEIKKLKEDAASNAAASRAANMPVKTERVAEPQSRELAMIQQTLEQSQRFMERAQAAEQQRLQQLEASSTATAAKLEGQVKKLEAQSAKTSTDVAEVTTLVTAVGTVLKGLRDETARMQEAYRAGFGSQQTFIDRLEAQQRQLGKIAEATEKTHQQLPFLLDGIKQSQEAQRALIAARSQKDVMQAVNNEEELQKLLQRQSEANDLIANRDLVLNFAAGLSRAGDLINDPSGKAFVAELGKIQKDVAKATNGLSMQDAQQYIESMASSYRQLWEQIKQAERAKAFAEGSKVPQSMRLVSAEQAEQLRATQAQMQATQQQLMEAAEKQKQAELRAIQQEEIRRQLQAEMERLVQESGKTVKERDERMKILEQALEEQQKNANMAQRVVEETRQTGILAIEATKRQTEEAKASLAEQLRRLDEERKAARDQLKAAKDTLEERERAMRDAFAKMENEKAASRQREHELRRQLEELKNARMALPPPAPSGPSEEELRQQAAYEEQERQRQAELEELEKQRKKQAAEMQEMYNRHKKKLLKVGISMPDWNANWSPEDVDRELKEARFRANERIASAFNPGEKPLSELQAEVEAEKNKKKRKEKEKEEQAPQAETAPAPKVQIVDPVAAAEPVEPTPEPASQEVVVYFDEETAEEIEQKKKK